MRKDDPLNWTGCRFFGADDPDTLLAVSNLGSLHQGYVWPSDSDDSEPTPRDLHTAKELFEEALEGRKRVLGEGHADTLHSTLCLGTLHASLGNHDLSKILIERALAGLRRLLGAEHPHTKECEEDLAKLNDLIATAAKETMHDRRRTKRRRQEGLRAFYQDEEDALCPQDDAASNV